MNFYLLTYRRTFKNDGSIINILQVLYYIGGVVPMSAWDVSKPLNNDSKIKNFPHIASFLMYLSWKYGDEDSKESLQRFGTHLDSDKWLSLHFKEILVGR